MKKTMPDHKNPLICIVVLNWNGWRMTLDCLQLLDAQSYTNYRMLVVENGSSDDSVTRLKEARPGLELIELDQNHGFAGGCNIGIVRALEYEPEYILLINNDAKATPDTLTKLVRAATESGAMICGGRVWSAMGDRVLFDGETWPLNIFGFRKSVSKSSISWSMADSVEGSILLMNQLVARQSLLERGYVFNPDYFMYCEETELCCYAKTKSWRIVVSHEASICHGVAKSSGGSGSALSYYYLTRNRIYLANKWLSGLVKVLFHVYYVPSRLVLQFKRSPQMRCAVYKGLIDGYLGVKGKWKGHGV